MVRRVFGRATAIPAASESGPPPEHVDITEPAGPTSRFIRYATVALWLTAGGLPLYVVRWKYGPISTTLLEGLVLATIGLFLLGRREEGARRFSRTPYDIPILLLLVAGAAAVLVPPDRWHALGLYRAYFVEPIALFYVAADLLRRPGQVRGLLLSLGAPFWYNALGRLLQLRSVLAAKDDDQRNARQSSKQVPANT